MGPEYERENGTQNYAVNYNAQNRTIIEEILFKLYRIAHVNQCCIHTYIHTGMCMAAIYIVYYMVTGEVSWEDYL